MLKNWFRKQIAQVLKELLSAELKIPYPKYKGRKFYEKDSDFNEVKETLEDVVKYKYEGEIQQTVQEYLATEEFIDNLVVRIKRKQL